MDAATANEPVELPDVLFQHISSIVAFRKLRQSPKRNPNPSQFAIRLKCESVPPLAAFTRMAAMNSGSRRAGPVIEASVQRMILSGFTTVESRPDRLRRVNTATGKGALRLEQANVARSSLFRLCKICPIDANQSIYYRCSGVLRSTNSNFRDKNIRLTQWLSGYHNKQLTNAAEIPRRSSLSES